MYPNQPRKKLCTNLHYLDTQTEQKLYGPVYTYHLRHRVRVRLCQIYIVCMVIVHLTVRMGSEPSLSIKRSISVDTMINFDRDGNGTCK